MNLPTALRALAAIAEANGGELPEDLLKDYSKSSAKVKEKPKGRKVHTAKDIVKKTLYG